MDSNDTLDEKDNFLRKNLLNLSQTERLKTAIEIYQLELKRFQDTKIETPFVGLKMEDSQVIDPYSLDLNSTEKNFIDKMCDLYYFSRSVNSIDLNVNTKINELFITKNKKSVDKLKVILANFLSIPIKRVVTFAKLLPDFSKLDLDDQLCLIQGGTMEISICSSSSIYDQTSKRFDNLISKEKGINGPDGSNVQLEFLKFIWSEDLYERTILFLKSIKELQLDEATLVIFLSLILFSPDRRGLKNRNHINDIQSKFSILLNKYMICKYGSNEKTVRNYNKLLLKLTELRALSEMHSNIILDADPNYLEPFPLAVISNKKEEGALNTRGQSQEEPVYYEL